MSKEEIINSIKQPSLLEEIEGYPPEQKKKYLAAFTLGRMAALFVDFRKMATGYKRNYSMHEPLIEAFNNPIRFIGHMAEQMAKYNDIGKFGGRPWQYRMFTEISDNAVIFKPGGLAQELRAIAGIGFNQQLKFNEEVYNSSKKNKKEGNDNVE
jgi:hypothetical protein